MMTDEHWRPVPGWEEFYEVSDQGRVRSLDRFVMQDNGHGQIRRQHRGRILKPRRNKQGHLHVVLISGRRHCKMIHRLVLEAFIGPCPLGNECCHANDVPDDNRLENLRWDTKSANVRDQVRNGRHAHARKTHCRRGHEYTMANTRIRSDGGRRCRICHRDQEADRYRRHHQHDQWACEYAAIETWLKVITRP